MLTWTQAEKLAPTDLWKAIAKSVYLEDDLFRVLPFARVAGKSHTYVREGAALTGTWIAPGGVVGESAQTFIEVTTQLRTQCDEVWIPGKVIRSVDGGMSQLAAQLVAKTGATARAWRDALINGNYPTCTLDAALTGVVMAAASTIYPTVGPNHKDGSGNVRVRVNAGLRYLSYRAPGDTDFGTESTDCGVGVGNRTNVQLVSGNGYNYIMVDTTAAGLPAATMEAPAVITSTTFSFDGLRRLVNPTLIQDSTGGAGDAFSEAIGRTVIDMCQGSTSSKILLMPRRTIRAYKTLLAAHGGVVPAMVSMERFGIPGQQLSLDGVPIFACDSIPVNLSKGGATTLTEIWCVSLGESDGEDSEAPYQGAGLVGLYGGSGTAMVDGQTCFGFFTDPIGKLSLRDAWGWQVGGEFGLALYGDKHAACYRHITN
jgi:hypothetical protein